MPVDDMVHEATYAQPPDLVWNAIATRQGLSAWLMENDLEELAAGATFTFRDRPRPFWDGVCPCRVLEVEPRKRLVLLWNTRDKHPSKVTFELTPTPDGGTRLRFRHEGLSGFMGRLMRLGMNKGWERMVRLGVPLVASQMGAGITPRRADVKARLRDKTAPAPGSP